MDVSLDDRAVSQITALRDQLNMSEEDLVKLAIQRLHNEVFITQEPDDGPLSDEYIRFVNANTKEQVNGQLEFDQSLFK